MWVGDFTYLRTWEGRSFFFSFIIDVFSRMIVGWQIARHMRTSLVLDALRMALAIRHPGADFQLVSHTDNGSQYTSEDYTRQLDDAQVLASVGSVGDCYDNALAESFVDSYKTELIADRVWRTHAQLELATGDYVAWFNTRRLHSSLGNRPPIEHEQRHAATLAAHPEALFLPTGSVTLNRSGVYDRLRPTGPGHHTNKIELLTRPTNQVSVEPRAFQILLEHGGVGCCRRPCFPPGAGQLHVVRRCSCGRARRSGVGVGGVLASDLGSHASIPLNGC